MSSPSPELLTFSVASCTFGFLCPIRRFKDLMASLGCTLFERITSEISRFKAMSSLEISISRGGTLISSALRIKDPGPGHTSLKTSPFRSAHREPSSMQTSQPSSQPLPKASCLARRSATLASRKFGNAKLCSARRFWRVVQAVCRRW